LKLDYRKTLLVGLAFLSIQMFWGFYEAVIAKMLIDSFGLSNLWSGVVMTLDNLLALFLLPLFGIWSDQTRSKFGKRTPFITVGIVVVSFLIIGVAVADFYQQMAITDIGIGPILPIEVNNLITSYQFDFQGVPQVYLTKELATYARMEIVWSLVTEAHPWFLISFIVILLFALLAMSLYRTPAVSLMPDVTPKTLRSEANALINLMGAVGGIVAIVLIQYLAIEFQPYVFAFGVLSLMMLIVLALYLLFVKEVKWVKDNEQLSIKLGLETNASIEQAKQGSQPLKPEVMRSFIFILASVFLWFFGFNAVTSKFSVYASSVLELENFALPLLVANLSALIGFVPLAYASNVYGRKNTILAGILLLAVGMFGAIFLGPQSAWLVYPVMVSAGIGFAAINVNSYPMVVDLASGNNIGKFTGYYYTASMAAQILTPIVSGALMDILPLRLQVLFPYAFVFTVLSFVTMLFVKHGDNPVQTRQHANR
jgi:maltose/moltooligosaccharide transporter